MSYWKSIAAVANETGAEWDELSKNDKHYLLSQYIRENGWKVCFEAIPSTHDYKITEALAEMMEVRHFKPGVFVEASRTAISTIYAILLTEIEDLVQMQYDSEVPDPEIDAFMISMNRGRV
jgi:hypothetical protein